LDETTPPLNPDGMQEPRETSPSPPDEQASHLDKVPACSDATEGKPPPNRWGQTTSPPVDIDLPPGHSDFHDSRPSHWSNTSWYHNNHNRCFDNPSSDGHHGYGGPSADCNHDGHHRSDYAPGPSQRGFEESYGARSSRQGYKDFHDCRQGYDNSHGDRHRNATSFCPGTTTVRNQYGTRHVNTKADPDTSPLQGGPITLPRAADKECQARHKGISHHDIAGLAAFTMVAWTASMS
jgi:hypothetical protein